MSVERTEVDARHSPFYAWLTTAMIRNLLRGAAPLAAGERLVLIKGLIPGLVDDMGEAAVDAFLDDLRMKAHRYAEALAHPQRGGASRATRGELLGGPTPGGEVRLAEARNPRRIGGRALERQWEAALWAERTGLQEMGAGPATPKTQPPGL